MNSRIAWVYVACGLGALVLALTACGDTHPSAGNGETHFQRCTSDGECSAFGTSCQDGYCRMAPASGSAGSRPDPDAGALSADSGAEDAGVAGSGPIVPRDAGPSSSDPCNLPVEGGACDAAFPRYHHDPATHTCKYFTYGGCGGNANNFASLAACEQACAVPLSEPCAIEADDPALPGVRVRISADRCRVQTGEHHRFLYTVEVDQPIAYTAPSSGGSCGRCSGYTRTPLSLVDTSIGDDTLRYCECDLGCCAPTFSEAVTLDTGSFDGVIEWPGVQWNGPSDTNQPLGGAFPPGSYEVRLDFEVPGIGAVHARLPIEVIDESLEGPFPASCLVDGQLYPSGSTGIRALFDCRGACTCRAGQLTDCEQDACTQTLCPDGMVFDASCNACQADDSCPVVRHGCLPRCEIDAQCEGVNGAACDEGICRAICG